jgi:non-heme chloroperoxidase
VPYADAGPLSAQLLPNDTLKTYKDLPHGCHSTHPDLINADLLAFFKGEAVASATERPAIVAEPIPA